MQKHFDPAIGLITPITDWGSLDYGTDWGRKWRASIVLCWLKKYSGPGIWWRNGEQLNETRIKAWILDGEAGELWRIVDDGKLDIVSELCA